MAHLHGRQIFPSRGEWLDTLKDTVEGFGKPVLIIEELRQM
mgnify:CR=1 FL=1